MIEIFVLNCKFFFDHRKQHKIGPREDVSVLQSFKEQLAAPKVTHNIFSHSHRLF
jgi:hypothetical protein